MQHSTRGQNMQISTIDVIRCVKPSSHRGISEGVGRSRKFFHTRGPVLASCKTPLTRRHCVRRAHCWRFVRIHWPNWKVTKASVLSLHFEQSFYRRLLKQWRSSAMPLLRCLTCNKDLVVVLLSLHTNWNKLKGSEVSIEIIFPRIIVICVISQARVITADDFLQTCHQDMSV